MMDNHFYIHSLHFPPLKIKDSCYKKNFKNDVIKNMCPQDLLKFEIGLKTNKIIL